MSIVSVFRLNGLSFRAKLTVFTLATTSIALLLSCVALIGIQYSNDRRYEEKRFHQISEVLAVNLGAAVLFKDVQAANDSLQSVRQIEGVDSVRVADETGTLIGTYVSAQAGGAPGRLDTDIIERPIRVNGEAVGTLRMGVHYRSLQTILLDTIGIALVVFGLCLSIAFVVAQLLRAMAFKPFDRLMRAMENVGGSGDYSTRVPPSHDLDFDLITNRFNAMIGQIQAKNTELSETLDALSTARDEAEKANIAKSRFLANMSHELRTPLNAIIGYTEVLQDELQEAGNTRSLEDVQWIYSSAHHLMELINGILDLSKIEAGRMDVEIIDVDVRSLLNEVRALLEPMAAHKKNQIHLNIQDEVGRIQSDSTKLRQCLLNLGSNAAKFTEDGHIFIVARTEGDMMVFEVADTGVGMDADQMARLFQPFVQGDTSTTRKYGGTGLGLTITSRFASLLGGSVSVVSHPGDGTTFTLKVRADGGVHAVDIHEQDGADVAPRTSDRPLALVIDDEPSAVQLLQRLLAQGGYDALSARDGAEGLQVARRHRPDLILLDIGMPRMNGWNVLEQLEADPALSGIPTVVVSIDDNRRRALALGASEHLVKPVDRVELGRVLNLYAHRRQGLVLIVEDDEATARLYERGLTQAGLRVRSVRDGGAALKVLARESVGLVLTDLNMPGVNGFELLDAISRMDSGHRPAVVVVTGKVLSVDESRRLQAQTEQVLMKAGLSTRQLLASIARLMPALKEGQAQSAAPLGA